MREDTAREKIILVCEFFEGYITALMELLEEEAIGLSDAMDKLTQAMCDLRAEVLKVIAMIYREK